MAILWFELSMSVKGSFLGETLSTLLAGEGLLSSVNTYVGFKAHFLSETLSNTEGMCKAFLQYEFSCGH